ncbi:MAG: hypothetical protein ABSB53_05095 [Nitrososphaerales archaeon]
MTRLSELRDILDEVKRELEKLEGIEKTLARPDEDRGRNDATNALVVLTLVVGFAPIS